MLCGSEQRFNQKWHEQDIYLQRVSVFNIGHHIFINRHISAGVPPTDVFNKKYTVDIIVVLLKITCIKCRVMPKKNGKIVAILFLILLSLFCRKFIA